MNGGHLAWFTDAAEHSFVTSRLNQLVTDQEIKYWYIGKLLTLMMSVF